MTCSLRHILEVERIKGIKGKKEHKGTIVSLLSPLWLHKHSSLFSPFTPL